jgi:hypothetical protein
MRADKVVKTLHNPAPLSEINTWKEHDYSLLTTEKFQHMLDVWTSKTRPAEYKKPRAQFLANLASASLK